MNTGHAFRIVSMLKNKNNITGFCNCDESVALFIKAGFSCNENVVKFPPEQKVCVIDASAIIRKNP